MDDPRISQLRAALVRNPGMTKRHAMMAFGLGNKTLKAWVDAGLVKFRSQKEKQRFSLNYRRKGI